MNSSLPTKRFCPHKPNILHWQFSHDAFKPSALGGSNPSALLAVTMVCAKGMLRKSSVSEVQASSLLAGVLFSGKHRKRLSSISDGSGFVYIIVLFEPWFSMYFLLYQSPFWKRPYRGIDGNRVEITAQGQAITNRNGLFQP
jgi:hypothetical protein